MAIDKNALAQQLSVRRQTSRLFGAESTTKEPAPILARLVEVEGTVMGSKGYGYLNYQPLGGGNPGQAFNLGRVQERAGTPVLVKFRDNQPVIDSVDFARMDDPANGGKYRSPLFSQHAPDHRWGAGDPAYLDTRQIIDLMVRPAGDFTVDVLPGWYSYGGVDLYFGGERGIDLSGSQPPSGTKRFVGLYLDADRTVKTTPGGIVARTLVLPEPAWPDGAFKLAAVILHGDQTFLDFEYVKQRKRIWAGGGAAWPFDNVVTVTNQAELETAIDDATDSTLILLDNDIQLTSTITITSPVTLAGFGGYRATTITGMGYPGGRAFTITGTNEEYVTFINLSIAALDSDILFVTNSSLRFIGCTLRILGPTTGDVACIASQATGARTADILLEVVDCDLLNDNLGNSYGFGVWVVNTDTGIDPLTAKIYHSRFNVVSFDITADDVTLKLYDPVLPNGVDLQGAAVKSGSWLDADGNRWPGISDLYQPDDNEAGGTPAVSVDTSGNVATVGNITAAGDAYLEGDEAGIKQRVVNAFQSAITDHFDGAFSGWTWAAYAGFVTPANLDVSTHPSIALIYNSAAQGVARAFAYQAAASDSIHARVGVVIDSRIGVRLDDGTNSNYFEFFVERGNSASSPTLRYRYANAGVVTGPTTVFTPTLVTFITVHIGKGANITAYYIMDTPRRISTFSIASWFTTARSGIYYELVSGTPGPDRSTFVDWYKQT